MNFILFEKDLKIDGVKYVELFIDGQKVAECFAENFYYLTHDLNLDGAKFELQSYEKEFINSKNCKVFLKRV